MINYKEKRKMRNIYVICGRCGGRHKIIPGVNDLWYFCMDEQISLQIGDIIEFEEENIENTCNRK